MRVLHLYRPRLPGLRAQAIQVVHTSHALARLGFEVTLLADREGSGTAADALALLGLTPHPRLHLHLSPVPYPPLAGLWFRTQLTRWWMGEPGVVLARDKARLSTVQRSLPRRHRIVLETHELDSALAIERGENSAKTTALETRCLGLADALVANCGGTLAAWREGHGDHLPPTAQVVHNATAADRARSHSPTDPPVLRYVGSLRPVKGLVTMLRDLDDLPAPLELIGGTDQERAELPEHILGHPPVPYDQVPDLLATASALILPLSNNIFGRALTSPLKLWDYLATATPIVAADLPTVREILSQMNAEAHLYKADDPASLIQATRAALCSGARTPALRTWDDRAEELAPILRGVP